MIGFLITAAVAVGTGLAVGMLALGLGLTCLMVLAVVRDFLQGGPRG